MREDLLADRVFLLNRGLRISGSGPFFSCRRGEGVLWEK